MKNVQARLQRERDELIAQLRRLSVSPRDDDGSATAGQLFEEGDQAQASERQDVEFAVRERVADRIQRLTTALARVDEGSYGRCQRCGETIEPGRLAAIPEVETCRRCQEQIEQRSGGRPAA